MVQASSSESKSLNVFEKNYFDNVIVWTIARFEKACLTVRFLTFIHCYLLVTMIIHGWLSLV